ncbi:MFS transporter [Natrialba taiwanensis]|uniref:Major facilitator superfamily protein n=1 Tax=Natrialba taiwanensis DSM 12281 TaxID=1230458 RepID=M0A758_9EURY|nr:MFS transporter [Natrialba taiwanensis]ELY94580.1 major facilitator superfamily protein [Natrialba taiwanensis DSM 12281]
MSLEQDRSETDEADPFDAFRQFFALERDVLVLSIAMFAFSLGFQMTSRYMGEYMYALGGTAFVVGLFGTFSNIISAVYPYPGGAISDRIGSRYALTAFGLCSTLGFAIWFAAPLVMDVAVGPTSLGILAVFVGLIFSQAWKSFGLGASFAIVKQAVAPSRLAAGFASTETFRRTAFLVGPLLAAVLFFPFGSTDSEVRLAFQLILVVAIVFGVLGTIVQHLLYEADEDSFGEKFEGVSQLITDLREMPTELRPLLIGDTLVRFANGMVYVFFVIVVTRFREVGLTLSLPAAGTVELSPQSYFGILLGIEMLVALLVMVPAAKAAERVGLKPVVTLGFAVYAVFPVVLISAPPDAAVLAILFAFSGLRFAGLPAHKALIVGPAETGAGGRVTGAYYLLRNLIVIPSAALGGLLWDGFDNPLTGDAVLTGDPVLAFTIATAIGLIGTAYFLVFGKEFDAYRPNRA